MSPYRVQTILWELSKMERIIFHATFPLFPKVASECDKWDNNWNIATEFQVMENSN